MNLYLLCVAKKKYFYCEGGATAGRGCPEELWSLHTYGCSDHGPEPTALVVGLD